MKKTALTAAIGLSLIITGSALAAGSYQDVPQGAWYQDAVTSLTGEGILDATQVRFRPGDNATRAEFLKLIVMMNGGLRSTPPSRESFDDVQTDTWYFPSMEEGAKQQWIKGENNCYGTRPCFARPNAPITRAEAAVLSARAFGVVFTGSAPQFLDNRAGQWYSGAIQAMADHCALKGDDATGHVRPEGLINRAEMVTLLLRLKEKLTWGVDCNPSDLQPVSSVSSVPAASSVSSSQAVSSQAPQAQGDEIPLTLAVIPEDPTMPHTIRRTTYGVSMLRVNMTSACAEETHVRGLTFVHDGTGSAIDLNEVDAFVLGNKVATAAFDAHAQTWHMAFDPPLTIPACKSVILDLRADISTRAQPGSDHALMIEFPGDMESNAKNIGGNFPLLGATFVIK